AAMRLTSLVVRAGRAHPALVRPAVRGGCADDVSRQINETLPYVTRESLLTHEGGIAVPRQARPVRASRGGPRFRKAARVLNRVRGRTAPRRGLPASER